MVTARPMVPLPSGHRVDALVPIPGSKSITNRALLLAALAPGQSVLRGALASEDTEVFARALGLLGVPVTVAGDVMTVRGAGGGPPVPAASIDVRLSGTSARFLCPFVGLGRGRYRVDGTARMRERPMGELVAALRAVGVTIEGGPNLPFTVVGSGHLVGGRVVLTAHQSSQHLSGILMVAPYADGDVVLELRGPTVSRSYVDMTLGLMAAFGVEVGQGEGVFRIPSGQRYRARTFEVEPDASAACYFWALAALSGGRVRTPGLSRRASVQGDVAFLDVLAAMGCSVGEDGGGGILVQGPAGGALRAVDVDMNDISDQVPTFAALALFADGPSSVRNVAHIRGKESDRIAAVATEVARLGARVEEFADGLRLWPLDAGSPGAVVQTYGDHRMAMAFALAGLRCDRVAIADPDCVRKTFPAYFEALERAIGVRR